MSPVRRVRRVIRKVDPWTVLKVSLIFNALMALAFLLGSVIFWSVFVNAGIPERISELAEALTLRFEPDGPTYFRVVALLCVIWTVMVTGLLTLSALLYNLISDIVGGIEVVVLEETVIATSKARPQPATTPRRVRPAFLRSGRAIVTEEVPEPAEVPLPREAPAAAPAAAAASYPAGDGDGRREPVAAPAAEEERREPARRPAPASRPERDEAVVGNVTEFPKRDVAG